MIKKQILTIDELKKLANRRWESQNDSRHVKMGIERGSLELFEQVFIESYNDGFRCCYCGRPLKDKSSYPYYEAPSLDHYVPISKGGDDDELNLAVCCHACNIVKGTMSGPLYEEVIYYLKKGPNWKEMISEWFLGRLASKIERSRNLKGNTK